MTSTLRIRMISLLLCLVFPVLLAQPAAAKVDQNEIYSFSLVWDGTDGDGTAIGLLKDGTALTVLSRQADYYEIDCYDMIGFIRAEQVRVTRNGEYYVNCKKDSPDTCLRQVRDLEAALTLRSGVSALALEQEGVPYVYGGASPRGFDCSGFIYYVFGSYGFSIHRGATSQLQDTMIISKDSLLPGDLVFFQNTDGEDGYIASHVGIYLGDGMLIHAGSGGITVVELEHPYFAEHYLCARRLILADSVQTNPVDSIVSSVQ